MSESNRLLNFATSSELIANGEGRNVLSAIAVSYTHLFPGMSILIVVAIFNLWSDSLRDVVDPKNQG